MARVSRSSRRTSHCRVTTFAIALILTIRFADIRSDTRRAAGCRALSLRRPSRRGRITSSGTPLIPSRAYMVRPLPRPPRRRVWWVWITMDRYRLCWRISLDRVILITVALCGRLLPRSVWSVRSDVGSISLGWRWMISAVGIAMTTSFCRLPIRPAPFMSALALSVLELFRNTANRLVRLLQPLEPGAILVPLSLENKICRGRS
mmetsp:Transcript_35522/g.77783  ORF Transcript_35522/g.77783 Transcript_35522/m.77783 type:complete len:205 (-) Transcript_35522:1402-2016(-)